MPFNTNNKIQIVDASGDACDNDNTGLSPSTNIQEFVTSSAVPVADWAPRIRGIKPPLEIHLRVFP